MLPTYHVGCSLSDENRLYVFSLEAGIVSETTESLQTDFKISLWMTWLLNLLSITVLQASFRLAGISSVLISVGEKLLTFELFWIRIAISTRCIRQILISFIIDYVWCCKRSWLSISNDIASAQPCIPCKKVAFEVLSGNAVTFSNLQRIVSTTLNTSAQVRSALLLQCCSCVPVKILR